MEPGAVWQTNQRVIADRRNTGERGAGMAQVLPEALPVVAQKGPDGPGGSADQCQVHGEFEGRARKGPRYLPRGGFGYLVGIKT